MYSLKEATKSALQVTPWGPVKGMAALGPSQAGGLGQQKRCEIQQGQMQTSTPGKEENLEAVQAGN